MIMRSRITNLLSLSVVAVAFAMPSAAFAQTAPGAATSMKSSGASAGQPSDSKLTSEVKQKLESDPATSNANIQVQTQDRMVTLRGKVPSAAVARKAQQIAARVNGVRGIENYMEYPKQ
jgi:osmotically-inducible protein OsmY